VPDPRRAVRLKNVLVGAGLFAALGAWLGFVQSPPWPTAIEAPAPHQVARLPGGTALRFAMVHDVLHERYRRHGDAYYEARNARARAALEAADPAALEGADLVAYLGHKDDLAAGLDRLGRSDEAVRVMRDKQALVADRYPEGGAAYRGPGDLDDPFEAYRLEVLVATGGLDPERLVLYRTCANLGTFLIHSSFRTAIRGDAAARARVEEGRELIERAIALNPGAHFGRETWQAVVADHLLAAIDDPSLLRRFDCVGNRLDEDPGFERRRRRAYEAKGIYYRRYAAPGGPLAALLDGGGDPETRFALREEHIAQIAPDREWVDATGGRYADAVPFDEPTLGIVGMWLFGGGANPHFALALGGLMERVGQRFVAWTAYARAAEMADRFWPNGELRRWLRDYCAERQRAIAESLRENPTELEARFRDELQYGRRYQAAFQAHESERLAAGAEPGAPGVVESFVAEHGEIASAPGKADVLSLQDPSADAWFVVMCACLGAGLGAWVGLLLPSSRRRP